MYITAKIALIFTSLTAVHVHDFHIFTTVHSDSVRQDYYSSICKCNGGHNNDMAKHIWQWCQEREIWLSACHIPGSTNVDADTESRKINSSTEWLLHSDVFADKQNVGPFQIDLFASRLNFKVPSYVSWKPAPDTITVNAFFTRWKEYYFYAYPHFNVIAACLQKIEQDQATGVLLVPIWQT